MDNPYQPPGAPVRDPAGGPRRSSLAAIGVGFATDILATIVFSTLLGVVGALLLAAEGDTVEDLAQAMEDSTGFQVIGLAGGLACTALGGYIAARFANHSEYANAFAVGVASLLFGEVMMMYAAQPPAAWLHVASAALVIPAAVVGGHLRAQSRAGR